MIPQETVDLILDTARIEDVIGDFVTLKRRGANLVACCPFHNEKTPSFYVSPSKGIYKCFGCGKAGGAALSGIYDRVTPDRIPQGPYTRSIVLIRKGNEEVRTLWLCSRYR